MDTHNDYPKISGASNDLKALFRCAHCRKVIERNSIRRWIPSYCEETGKNVRLIRVKYRYLKEGETIKEGDECETSNSIHDPSKWEPASRTVGGKVPSPIYPAHRKYRRLIPA